MTIRTAFLLTVLASPISAFVIQGHIRSSFCLNQSMKPVYIGDKQEADEYLPEKPSALVPLEPVENNEHLNEKKYHWTEKQPVFEMNWDGSVPKYVDMRPQNRQQAFFY